MSSSTDSDRKPSAFHGFSADDTVRRLATNVETGLTDGESEARRAEAGYNELPAAQPAPWWRKLLAQFNELVIWILIAAAIISGVVGDLADTLAICAIVLANGLIGFFQEERAERSLAALKNMAAPLAKVRRGGALQQLPARLLVPGDIIDLEAGDRVPADGRLLRAFSLRDDESALTGESVPVEKSAEVVLAAQTPIGDRRNMIHMATVVTAGKGLAVVTAIGRATELGRIASLLEGQEQEPTPLQRRLAQLGRYLVVICLVIVAIIFVLELLRGGELLNVLLISISLAVAAVPEGLPAVVTIALAIGLERMVKRNALVRKLPSVETLGSVTAICSDKTGTLTRNQMTVRRVVAGGEAYDVSGVGYSSQGRFLRARENGASGENRSSPGSVAVEALPDDLRRALEIGLYCNNAEVSPGNDGNDSWKVVGDPTEGALVILALKAHLTRDEAEWRLVEEIPFDSDRKAMSVVLKSGNGRVTLYSKGAPEVLLSRCAREWRLGQAQPLTDERRGELNALNQAMAREALRVLALAFRDDPAAGGGVYSEEDLVFAGMVGMIDPPRDEARPAIKRCQEAGIRPIMITGDHPETAAAIAREVGIVGESDEIVTGVQLEAMPQSELEGRVDKIAVYARVTAEHKLRVVRALKTSRQIVAMTGDGVNDAPAIKAADIGIAMGITGTDVTKEASDMILMDDNFASIVNAVEEGRGIYNNIQKFVHYLLSCNAAEVLFMFFAALVGWPAPLAAIQILWINLVTDGLPALALGVEPPEPDTMRRRPRRVNEPVITGKAGLAILLQGMLIAGATILIFAAIYTRDPDRFEHARTAAFCTLAFSQLFFSLACRSWRYTLPELGLFSNPYLWGAIVISGLLQLSAVLLTPLRPYFLATTHPWQEWGLIFMVSLLPVSVVETFKILRAGLYRRRQTRADRPKSGLRP